MKRKITALIIVLNILVGLFPVSALAGALDIGSIATGLNGAFNLADSNEKKRSDISNWLQQNSQWGGFIFDSVSAGTYLTPSVVWSCLPQSVKDSITDSNDDSEILDKTIDMILEGQSVSGNNITNNTNVNTFIKNVQNDYVNSHPTIGYTYLLSEIAQRISYSDVYNALKSYIADADDIQGNVFVVILSGLSTQVIKIPNATMAQDSLYVKYGNIGTLNGYRYSQGNMMSMESDTSPRFSYVQYNNTTKTFEPAGETYGQAFQLLIDNVDPAIQVGSNQTKFIVSKKYRVGFKIFHSKPTVSDYMYSPFYYNNDVWQDFSTSNGDYTFSPSNINTISYGDTTTYIDSFNTEEGFPPSIPQINNYITQQNEQNVNSGSGGSGGSGDNGSGGSGGSGDMSIFDFLSRIGEVLGGLIKNLGNMLTSLIEGIVTVITDLLTEIPDTVNVLIGSVFGWLPTELKALFALGISLMVLVGLIRLFKG